MVGVFTNHAGAGCWQVITPAKGKGFICIYSLAEANGNEKIPITLNSLPSALADG